MKQKGSVSLIILIPLLMLLVFGVGVMYYTFFYPQKQLEKARTPDNSIKTESAILPPKTEIREKGLNSTIIITPSNNDVISGKVTIKAVNVPADAKHVGFSINKSFDDLGKGGPNLGFDSTGTDGWEILLDTTEYENGTYYIALFVFNDDASSNPIGVTNAKLEIRN